LWHTRCRHGRNPHAKAHTRTLNAPHALSASTAGAGAGALARGATAPLGAVAGDAAERGPKPAPPPAAAPATGVV
jgi:hypothetical protein